MVESTKSQVLHFDDRQGKVPFCDVEACARELWTRVSQIFLLKAGERGGGKYPGTRVLRGARKSQ